MHQYRVGEIETVESAYFVMAPDRIQRVQTFTLRRWPLTTVLTSCRLGRETFLVLLFA